MIFMTQLYPYQLTALNKMHNGSILCGGVGSGKSLTALGYYIWLNGGDPSDLSNPMKDICPKDLYIITTARKRDTGEWESELRKIFMSTDEWLNYYNNDVTIDSWNNIKKYTDVDNAFFIFDEQRVVGSGSWVKSFLKITKKNDWILLSATPGDKWEDYIPVFMANGFYRNRTEFSNQHLIYARYLKFPKVTGYANTGRLIRLRNNILVNMDYEKHTTSYHRDIFCDYDRNMYKDLWKSRWNYEKNCPIENISELCYKLRKVVNSDKTRGETVLELHKSHKKLIIFYNFDYELAILKNLDYGSDCVVAEWNGHKHEEVPDCDNYVYLVQYTAGAEGWNCITTDTIIFYSQNYSYKAMVQAAGRIDRLNSPFTELYFYHLKSHSGIDLAISRALSDKKDFNQMKFAHVKT